MFSIYSVVIPLYIFSIFMMHIVYIFHLVGKQMSSALAPAAVDYAEGRLLQFSWRELSKVSFHFFFVACLFSRQFTQHLDHEPLVNWHLLSLFLGTVLNTGLRTFLITEWGAPCDRFIVYYTGVGQVVTTFWVRPGSQEIIKIWSRPLDSKYQHRTEFDSCSSERKESQLIS